MYEKLRQVRKELFGIDAPVMKSREVFRRISLKDLGREKPFVSSKKRKLKVYPEGKDLKDGKIENITLKDAKEEGIVWK